MKFTVSEGGRQAVFFIEEQAYPGVKRVGKKAAEDLRLVTGKEYQITEELCGGEETEAVIFAATTGRSGLLEQLEEGGFVDLSELRGKWECYLFRILPVTEPMREKIPALRQVRELLVIAGSDKRGTIYGIFHLSELAGVSPWVYWADVRPGKRETLVLTDEVNLISREPSVKYRGFFINDEWPSFGTWTMKHFGGFTSEMYDHVFELLLRLKGNYLWPAMWTSSFSLDGPGLANAKLADEYGIVMSNSHHEPCLRHSEEWDLVRGEASVYGNAWNFDRNREGLKAYWRDGLRRNGGFENIITVGMRGERDSEILGRNSGLADNINYLKEVITTQNQLIREEINPDLDQVPRMLALYKEVEAYYYGDEQTPGLAGWEELDGITLMLCEDNFGNMRTLPTADTRNRKGGFGMYYHFDYHGGPISYEWINSTWLLKVWEQMGMAYETGIRQIWVVNVGDLKPQELPLSYFMDLAYDFETWGRKGPEQAEVYTKRWIDRQFGQDFTAEEREEIRQVIDGYTRQNNIRKPEALGTETWHPVHYGESDRLLKQMERLEQTAERLNKKAETLRPLEDGEQRYAAFYELVYFPVMATANLVKMQLYAGKNRLYAEQGRISANRFADRIGECIRRDRELQEGYYHVAGGKWDGMMGSEHIGFVNWNDEECRYPSRIYIEPSNKPRMIAAAADDTAYTTGGEWTGKRLIIRNFTDPYAREAVIEIANGSTKPFHFTAVSDAAWLKLSGTGGEVTDTERIVLTIDRDALHREALHREALHRDALHREASREDAAREGAGWREPGQLTAHVEINAAFAHVKADVVAADFYGAGTDCPYVSEWGAAIEASDYAEKTEGINGSYLSVPLLGIYPTAEKPVPATACFEPGVNAPSLTYEVMLPEDGRYEITCLTTPSNPTTRENHLRFGFRWNEEEICLMNTVSSAYRSGDPDNSEWARGVLDQIHRTTFVREAKRGRNRFTVFACDPACVLERILIIPEGKAWRPSYLGRSAAVSVKE